MHYLFVNCPSAAPSMYTIYLPVTKLDEDTYSYRKPQVTSSISIRKKK